MTLCVLVKFSDNAVKHFFVFEHVFEFSGRSVGIDSLEQALQFVVGSGLRYEVEARGLFVGIPELARSCERIFPLTFFVVAKVVMALFPFAVLRRLARNTSFVTGVLDHDLIFKGFDRLGRSIAEPFRFADVLDLQFVGCVGCVVARAPEKRRPSLFGRPDVIVVFEFGVPQKRHRYGSRVRANNSKVVLTGCPVVHPLRASALDLNIATTPTLGVAADAHFAVNDMKRLGDRKRKKKRMSERSRRQNTRSLGTTAGLHSHLVLCLRQQPLRQWSRSSSARSLEAARLLEARSWEAALGWLSRRQAAAVLRSLAFSIQKRPQPRRVWETGGCFWAWVAHFLQQARERRDSE